jgi:hypothetical protein
LVSLPNRDGLFFLTAFEMLSLAAAELIGEIAHQQLEGLRAVDSAHEQSYFGKANELTRGHKTAYS